MRPQLINSTLFYSILSFVAWFCCKIKAQLVQMGLLQKDIVAHGGVVIDEIVQMKSMLSTLMAASSASTRNPDATSNYLGELQGPGWQFNLKLLTITTTVDEFGNEAKVEMGRGSSCSVYAGLATCMSTCICY